MSSTWRSGLWPALLLVALAVPLHAQSFGFPWWKGQAEVIVGREIEHARVRNAEDSAQAGLFELGEFAVKERIEIHLLRVSGI